MTVLAGCVPGRDNTAVLHHAATVAHATGSSVVALSVVPMPWTVPSQAKVDAEYTQWWRERAAQAGEQATAVMTDIAASVSLQHRVMEHGSASSGILVGAREADAEVIVVGARRGRDGCEPGSTTNQLAHSSPVPVAIVPGRHRDPRLSLSRVTCAVGSSSDEALVDAVTAMMPGIALRVATFGVRHPAMYPPEVGLSIEDEVLAAWREDAERTLRNVTERRGLHAEQVVAVGAGWRRTVASLDWWNDEILAIGSHRVSVQHRVFLGDNAAKLLRHAPVPTWLMATR